MRREWPLEEARLEENDTHINRSESETKDCLFEIENAVIVILLNQLIASVLMNDTLLE